MKTQPKRKKHNAAFKAKVGMEAMLGIKTVAQIAREYGVHPVQVSQWKSVIRDRLPELFEAGGKAGEDTEKVISELHRVLSAGVRRVLTEWTICGTWVGTGVVAQGARGGAV